MSIDLNDYIKREINRLALPDRMLPVMPQEEAEAIIGLALLSAGRTMSWETFKLRCAEFRNRALRRSRQDQEDICISLGLRMKDLETAITKVGKYKMQIDKRIRDKTNENIRKTDEERNKRREHLY